MAAVKVGKKQKVFTVGFVVTIWMDQEIPAADMTDALAKASMLRSDDLVQCQDVNDVTVLVAGVTDMTVIDRVNS